jgi:drug/metabolite transporter (DMT)-like permease
MSQPFIDGRGILLLGLVGLLWGGTNPLIELSVKQKSTYNISDYSPKSVLSIAASRLFLIAMGINQIGSLLYASLLGLYSEQYTNLLANAFATVFTFISESCIKRERPSKTKIFGVGFVMIGLFFILT